MGTNLSEVRSVAVAVVIATKNRSAKLANRALRSVSLQTRPPDFLVVVDDSDRPFQPDNRRIVASVSLPNARIKYLLNDRTPGASGAWNVALDYLHRGKVPPESMFVAILDDDDEWAPSYLEFCLTRAELDNLDMVAAGIDRIEDLEKTPISYNAPEKLYANNFLVGNPGIQGSNLFVRLSCLLAAGLFDESLMSCTDRDLCVRLADLGNVRYGREPRILVSHHAEPDRTRLTQSGSVAKHRGLDAFWRKYRRRMSIEQRASFKERAAKLFAWHPTQSIDPSNNGNSLRTIKSCEDPIALIVGVTADPEASEKLLGLLDDLRKLLGDRRLAGLDIVILENGHRAEEHDGWLEKVAISARDSEIGCFVVTLERQMTDASAGLFGLPFDRQNERASIAQARDMLQTYLYAVAKPRTGAVVWILDVDLRLECSVWTGGSDIQSMRQDLLGSLGRLKEIKTSIAIGTVTDAPPLPSSSCMRTQLVDAFHNLANLANMSPDDEVQIQHAENMDIRSKCEDYYYDLSRRDTDHLENPFWYVPSRPGMTAAQVFCELAVRLPRMFAGEQVFRPLVVDGTKDPVLEAKPSIHRGGNTIVFDVEALREFPNASAHIGGVDSRRSDMIWSLLNRYIAQRSIVKVSLAVKHDRSGDEIQGLDLKKLKRDINGYALYSALEDVLIEQHERLRSESDSGPVSLDKLKIDRLKNRMHKYLTERVAAFSLSYHRAAGLASAMRRYVDAMESERPWWLERSDCQEAVQVLRQFIERLSKEYDLKILDRLRADLQSLDEESIHVFVDQLKERIASRKTKFDGEALTDWLVQQRTLNARTWLKREFGPRHFDVLGCGSEAVVFTDGKIVYKCLDYWKSRMPPERLDFLRSQIGLWEDIPGLYALREVRKRGPWAVITYDYEKTRPYMGGHGLGLVQLLRGCREVGIVCNNIHPDNLRVTDKEVKLIDYGSDIRPYTDELFKKMAHRAYLSWRYWDRENLKLIMRRALKDFSIPELKGFDLFLSAVEPTSKEELLDERILKFLSCGEGRSLLDYGCGRGKLALGAADSGWKVTAWDPNSALYDARPPDGASVQFIRHNKLDKLRKHKSKFDVVVCCLVLCILDEEAFSVVIKDLRLFVTQDGEVIVAVCNPDHFGGTTQLQRRIIPEGVSKNDTFVYEKVMLSTGNLRQDVHRPLHAYVDAFRRAGLDVIKIEETPGIDLETFTETSDFMIFYLRSTSK